MKETMKDYSYPTKVKPTEKELFELSKINQRTRRDMSNESPNIGSKFKKCSHFWNWKKPRIELKKPRGYVLSCAAPTVSVKEPWTEFGAATCLLYMGNNALATSQSMWWSMFFQFAFFYRPNYV